MTALALAPDTRISYEPAAAARVDRAIRVSTAIAVLAVAGVAAYVSYWHAYAVVCAHGETGITARLEPATIDGLVYASSMVNLYAARHRLPVPALARSHSASARHWPPTWPRDGPTDQSARSSRPGQRSAWWAATNCWSGSSGPQPRETWAAGQPRTTTGRRRTAMVPASGSLLLRGLDAAPGNLAGLDTGLTPGGADGLLRVRGMAGAGLAGGPGWNAADQMADQSSGSRGPVTAVSQGGDINAAAVAAYRASLQAGRPLSERKLAGQFGMTSRRWARSRMAEARQSPAPA